MDRWEGLTNPVIWLIGVVATAGFAWMIHLLTSRSQPLWATQVAQALPPLQAMVSALPLLGLLGTIVGLLDTFRMMSIERGFDPTQLVSGGIADAMLTTQIGLLMAIPGWIGLAVLQAAMKRETT